MSYAVSIEKTRAILLGHFTKLSKRSLLLRGYLTVFLIAIADYATDPDLSFLIFYFLPIIAVSWFLGRKSGIAISVVAVAARFAHDMLLMNSYLTWNIHELTMYWASLQRLLVFLTVSIIVAALRSSEDKKRTVEQKIARQVQSFLTHHTTPSLKHFNYSGHSKSSDHLSGDLFDCFLIGADKVAFMIGDICGKGISAALLMAYIQGVLRSHVPISEDNLVELMKTVNRSLHVSTADDKFASLFMGVYDDARRTLTYVNAGHDPPRVLRLKELPTSSLLPSHPRESFGEAQPHRQDSPDLEVLKLEPGGLLLGIDPSADFVAHVIQLRLGDILVCDTDGVQEARNNAGEQYGHERLTMAVARNWEQPASRIHGLVLKNIQQFVGAEPQFDDMTLLIGKVV
jgi:serine phosphatase RsbU (regulator of sigma subunit)